jgi:hypothetical protein
MVPFNPPFVGVVVGNTSSINQIRHGQIAMYGDIAEYGDARDRVGDTSRQRP